MSGNVSAMATDYRRVADFLRDTVATKPPEEIAKLKPHHGPAPPRVPSGNDLTAEAIESRWRVPDSPAIGARSPARRPHCGRGAGLCAKHRELHWRRSCPDWAHRPASRQRVARQWRLLRAAGDHRGGTHCLPFTRSPSDHRGRRLHGGPAQRGRQPRTRLCLRLDCGRRAVRRVGNHADGDFPPHRERDHAIRTAD